MPTFAEILATHALPPVEGEVLEARWIARSAEWWARTSSGWFWFDARARKWMLSHNGPAR